MKLASILILSVFVVQSVANAGAPGPFESCAPVEQKVIQSKVGEIRGTQEPFVASVLAQELECTLSGKITGYKYNIDLLLEVKSGGLINPNISASPILVNGNLMFKDKTQGNFIPHLSTLSSASGTTAAAETTYIGRLHASNRVGKIGLDVFIESVKGFSMLMVSDEIPTTRLQLLK